MIEISHSHAEGTVAEGTSKGDGAGDILKANGFTYRYGAWRVQGSRDRMSSWKIQAAAEALRAADFKVAVEVDDTPRSTAVVEAERAGRAAARAERFTGYSENAAGRSEAAEAGAREIQRHIPFGQPVLYGHHSQKKHEKALERIDSGLRKSFAEGRKATHWAGRAESAENAQRYRENVYVTLRRIDRMEAELRADRRIADRRAANGVTSAEPTRLDLRISHLEQRIAYWRAQVAAAEAAGAKVWRPADFAKGDVLQCGGSRWLRVVRVNKKSVSVEHPTNPTAPPVPLPYDGVTGHRTAAEHAAATNPEGSRD
ncbi:DUF3560 domain-containing protein [Parafrankia sp. FMc2]|uniref:DUF3560 domain-containing protein n=1 Tax=Parafrankia sp. FMc2 TaxID=3233196 RepID=UPI0034D4345C